MAGILDKFKSIFGKRPEIRDDVPIRRMGSIKKPVDEDAPQEFVPRYKMAKKMREDKEMETPLVKRKRY